MQFLDSKPAVEHPQISFTVVDGGVSVKADWPPGADLNVFAVMLGNLCRGEYEGVIGRAVANGAERAGEPQKASQVRHMVSGPDTSPVVPKTAVFRHLMRD